jgi:NAD(P)-dependent dehydrogenase (short-subunit alcohol dehydrogenase family)
MQTIVITGAAEGSGHATSQFGHANGYKVDLRPSQQLADHINSNFTRYGGVLDVQVDIVD